MLNYQTVTPDSKGQIFNTESLKWRRGKAKAEKRCYLIIFYLQIYNVTPLLSFLPFSDSSLSL